MWRQLISGWADAVTFADPAPEAAIRECAAALGHALPADLANLLRESNGVVAGEYDVDLIWPVERIIADNALFRTDPEFATLYMPFDALLFFADDGGGNQFAFVVRDRPADVFVWDHETDSRTMVAPNLAGYLEHAAKAE